MVKNQVTFFQDVKETFAKSVGQQLPMEILKHQEVRLILEERV